MTEPVAFHFNERLLRHINVVQTFKRQSREVCDRRCHTPHFRIKPPVGLIHRENNHAVHAHLAAQRQIQVRGIRQRMRTAPGFVPVLHAPENNRAVHVFDVGGQALHITHGPAAAPEFDFGAQVRKGMLFQNLRHLFDHQRLTELTA